ncbi:MAG TPA: glycosyltransferase [Acidimicrobiales bacterium]|nr:glycosyltransferase [Acidimicrobiales bacterium]
MTAPPGLGRGVDVGTGSGGPRPVVVALVPAKDRADSIGATVAALSGVVGVDEVVVVDDGSTDETADAAFAAGARVVVLPANRGKGGAVHAGVSASPHADVFLLIDADLGATAAVAGELLTPVLAGEAEMVVAVLPSSGTKGGFGSVRRLAGAGIARATTGGFRPRSPLSGQRAVDARLLRSLPLADRFGLEVGLTIDAVRTGARVVEVDLPMDHRHTGRSVAGFRHRGAQGAHVVRALWPRLTSARQRALAIVVLFALLAGTALWSGKHREPASVAATAPASKVVVFGIPKLGWADVGTGAMPVLDGLVRQGAVAATSVRTLAGRPSTAEGYATLGAGSRVRADANAGFAFEADDALEGGTAAEALVRRGGGRASGGVAVVGAPATFRMNEGRHLPSQPGTLGDALRRAGRKVAVVGNADIAPPRLPRRPVLFRPAAAAAMDGGGWVTAGEVGRQLVTVDPSAPFGIRADPGAMHRAVAAALAEADVVVVDPGDMDRAAEFAAVSTPRAAAEARHRALRSTDVVLGEVVRAAGPDALLLVVSVVPPGKDWHLTPMVASGRGVVPGYLHSPSTRRLGVVTLTDVAPTVLDALDAPVADGMIGHPLRYHRGRADLGRLRDVDRDADFREALYFPLTFWFIVLQAVAYTIAVVTGARLASARRTARVLPRVALAIAAWPAATFVLRAIPAVAVLGAGAVAVLVAIDAVLVAAAVRLGRRRLLGPLSWVCGATVALLVADLATGARLQTSSLLGYSYHSAARFTGLGNTAFGMLAATAILAVALHVHHAPRRVEALITAACVLALVALADGAPSLGSDVGGILTLVPVFGLTLLVLSGRRLSWRAVGLAAGAALVVVLLATGVDLLRPPGSRTHLGELAARIGDEGLDPVRTTLDRKVAANLRSFRSPWAWVIAITAAYLLAVLAWAQGWARLLPPRSALRAGLAGVLAAGLIGYAVNDSGAVVTGLAYVYVGPLLTLLVLGRDEPAVRVLEPPDAAWSASGGGMVRVPGRRLVSGT